MENLLLRNLTHFSTEGVLDRVPPPGDAIFDQADAGDKSAGTLRAAGAVRPGRAARVRMFIHHQASQAIFVVVYHGSFDVKVYAYYSTMTSS